MVPHVVDPLLHGLHKHKHKHTAEFTFYAWRASSSSSSSSKHVNICPCLFPQMGLQNPPRGPECSPNIHLSVKAAGVTDNEKESSFSTRRLFAWLQTCCQEELLDHWEAVVFSEVRGRKQRKTHTLCSSTAYSLHTPSLGICACCHRILSPLSVKNYIEVRLF